MIRRLTGSLLSCQGENTNPSLQNLPMQRGIHQCEVHSGFSVERSAKDETKVKRKRNWPYDATITATVAALAASSSACNLRYQANRMSSESRSCGWATP